MESNSSPHGGPGSRPGAGHDPENGPENGPGYGSGGDTGHGPGPGQAPGPDPAAARAALDAASETRASLADRVDTPWWYHAGLALGTALGFASLDFDYGLSTYGIITGWILIPMLLGLFVARATGLGPSIASLSKRPKMFGGLLLAFIGGVVAAALFKYFLPDLRGVLTGWGVLLGVWAAVVSHRCDDILRRELRSRL
ncbi:MULTISPECIES: hypothetical protein [unclassified Streptomyces]|uniref:hypothetical protein n=1 Tax=unclassified Streptomyces TaxID=2593676 RepID=UPI000D1F8D35|nr:hypothetical protein [Streptomyces sp. Ru87]